MLTSFSLCTIFKLTYGQKKCLEKLKNILKMSVVETFWVLPQQIAILPKKFSNEHSKLILNAAYEARLGFFGFILKKLRNPCIVSVKSL